MSSLLQLLAVNATVAGSVAALLYARHYLCLSHEKYLSAARPVTDETYSRAHSLSGGIKPLFDDLVKSYEARGKKKGRLDPRTVILSRAKRDSGYPVEASIFIGDEEEPLRLNVGLLVCNAVSARNQPDYPLELAAQAMYLAIPAVPHLRSWVGAFDKDLFVLKSPGIGFDATTQGILPKKIGYHASLPHILGMLPEEFSAKAEATFLYIITGPILRNREETRQQLAMLKNRNVHTGIIHINFGGRPITPLTHTSAVVSPEKISELPGHIERINEILMEEVL